MSSLTSRWTWRAPGQSLELVLASVFQQDAGALEQARVGAEMSTSPELANAAILNRAAAGVADQTQTICRSLPTVTIRISSMSWWASDGWSRLAHDSARSMRLLVGASFDLSGDSRRGSPAPQNRACQKASSLGGCGRRRCGRPDWPSDAHNCARV